MAAFEYQALNQNGQKKKGVLEADSARHARQQLREKGLIALSVEPISDRSKSAGASAQKGSALSRLLAPSMSPKELALCTRQLATLVQAAMPLEEVLQAVAAQSERSKVKSLLLAVRSKVTEGHTLADSMAEFPSAFPEMYRSTVAAGEHAGHLGLVLNELADYTENKEQSRQKIQLALLYPGLLTVASVAIVSFLLAVVVPDVVKVFIRTGNQLPPLTAGLIAVSDFLKNYGLHLLLLLCAGFLLFSSAYRKPAFRKQVDHFLVDAPLSRKISRGMNAARFAGTLSILTKSGVPLVEGLSIAGAVMPNYFLRDQIQQVAQKVREGSSLFKALESIGRFPPMMLYMIASGERSGELEPMLDRAARQQQQSLEALMATVVGLFEPVVLIAMGGVVLTIVLAILLPILNMNQLIG